MELHKEKVIENLERKVRILEGSGRADPLTTLLQIYRSRDDLQRAYPEVKSGQYEGLVDWASEIVRSRAHDLDLGALSPHKDWFARNRIRICTEPEKRVPEQNAALRIPRPLTSLFDRMTPDGTLLGELRKLLVMGRQIALSRGVRYLIAQGFAKIRRKEFWLSLTVSLGPQAAYNYFLMAEKMAASDVGIRHEISKFSWKPLISLILPTYNTPIKYLEQTVAAVCDQLYDNWELCICDDGSRDEFFDVLEDIRRSEGRIKLKKLSRNSGVARASNEALCLATGEFVALLDHDDLITPDALYHVVKALNAEPSADFLYSDDDKVSRDGIRFDPFFKPDWSPELLRSIPYISHLTVIRKSLIDNIGGFDERFHNTPDYDLQLRATDRAVKVVHIPRVLYSWRVTSTSASNRWNIDKFKLLCEENLAELRRFADERKLGVVANWMHPNVFRVRYDIVGKPRVSIIIVTYDKVALLEKCLQSIEESSYQNREVIIVTNNPDPNSEMWAFLLKLPHTVVKYSGNFNWAKMNNRGVEVATGEYVLFLNDDVEVMASDWLESMLGYAQQADVGAVGCRLLFPNGRCQHAGVTGDPIYVARHHFKNVAGDGYFNMTILPREVSAVTGACMMTKRRIFKEMHGFDTSLEHVYNDVDYCWKLGERGDRVVYDAFATLRHHEGASPYRGINNEITNKNTLTMLRRWRGKLLGGDPFHNPGLTNAREDLFLINRSFYPATQDPTAKKSILLLTHNLNLEGSTIGLFHIGKFFRHRGYAVVVASPHDGKLRAEYLRNGIAVLVIPGLDHLCSIGYEDLRTFMASFDVIFANTILMYFVIPFVRAFGHPANPKIIWIVRESPDLEELCRELKINIEMLNYSFAHADRVVFLCKATADLYTRFARDNFQVIHDSVDPDEYLEMSDACGYHLDKRYFNVICVGTIYHGKGQDVLVDAAIDLLTNTKYPFKFYIVGKPGDQRFYGKLKHAVDQHHLQDRIIFTGELGRAELYSCYSECNLFVLPSRRESFPTVVLEAMHAGKPIIATGIYGVTEQLKDNYSGLLIPSDDKASLIDSILKVYRDKKLALLLGNNARREFFDKFTVRNMEEYYLKLVGNVTKAPAKETSTLIKPVSC